MLLRDNRYTPSLFLHVRYSSIFYPDSRHPEGRSCTPFRRTISAYLKSICYSVRCMNVARSYTYVCATRACIRACGTGKTHMQKLAGTLPEAAARQYIIEIYKFSSTLALFSKVGMRWWRRRQYCSFKPAREGRATTISAVLTGEIFKRPSLILPPSRVERRPYSTLRASRALLDPYLTSITRTVHAK